MKKLLLTIALIVGISASAQQVDLNVDFQNDDYYFTKGGINIGASTTIPLNNISDRFTSELGFGFFKDNADTKDYMKFNVLTGIGYQLYGDAGTPIILKANFRGYLINDEVKGYFEPGAELRFSDYFAMTFNYAFEIHRTGFNVPTGRLGFKFKL